jgi:hypothetical protein
MRLFIASPSFNGMFCSNYVRSLIESIGGLHRDSIKFEVYSIAGEPISHARNSSVTAAIEWGADKLLFIDADIGWKWEHMRALIRSDKLVVGGTYPVKRHPIRLVYNVLPEHYYAWQTKSVEEHERIKALADPATGELAVMHIPTGFVMIDMKVFEMLRNQVPAYVDYWPGLQPKKNYDFFPMQIKDGTMLSEDFCFCRMCNDNGINVYLNTNIICSHMGIDIYAAE